MSPIWKKLPNAKPFLEMYEGKYKTSYRVRYRQDKIKLEQNLEGDFKDWKAAQREAERLIYEAKYGKKPKDKGTIRTEDLCDEIVSFKKSLSDATYRQTEMYYRFHIKPFIRGECVYSEPGVSCPFPSYRSECIYASDLNPSVYLTYKTHLRLHKPKSSLFNHWKFFSMLFKHAFEKGVLERPIRLPYDEEKEDFRKRGQIVSDDEIKAMVNAANRTWKDRIILQRLTGQRPGVIRGLRKDQVNLETGELTVEKADSKNRRHYSFILPVPAIKILKDRLTLKNVMDSPYFFPMETDHGRPMEANLQGWKSALQKAGIAKDYTPHDLRHTFLTEKFKNCPNPALVCYQCDLSLDEAMATYTHFEAEDTRLLADQTTSSATYMDDGEPQV